MKTLLILTLSYFVFACSHHGPKPEGKKLDNGFSYVSHKGKVFLSGQPKAEDLKKMTEKESIDVVINIRSDKEIQGLKFQPKADATKQGLKYYQISFMNDGKPDPANIAKIEETFMKYHKDGKNVLVNCGSGQRAAAWFGAHFKLTHKSSAEEAMQVAEKYGLSNTSLKSKVKTYLSN